MSVPDVQLVLAEPADLAALSALAGTADPHAWSESAFAGSIRDGHDVWLLRSEGVVQGCAVFQRVLDEAELLYVVIALHAQGRGLGHRLLMAAMQRLEEAGIARLHLEVRQSNLAAQAVYRRCGFGVSGRRKGYYPAPAGLGEDALLMSKVLVQEKHADA